MGYYVRVLSTSADCVPLSKLKLAIQKANLQALLVSDSDDSEDWTDLVLSHSDGLEIAAIERNLVEEGELGQEELEEYKDEIGECKPASATQWLLDYFESVRCIYAFQVLSGTRQSNGWEILDAVKSAIWSFAPSIMQADGEGFSNEAGYHILWQFDDGVDGKWSMGVIQDGKWTHFEMELGDLKQREAFFLGKVPPGASLATE